MQLLVTLLMALIGALLFQFFQNIILRGELSTSDIIQLLLSLIPLFVILFNRNAMPPWSRASLKRFAIAFLAFLIIVEFASRKSGTSAPPANITPNLITVTPVSSTQIPTVAVKSPDLIENPLAEKEGLVWDATFYGNKELRDPITLKGKIRGTANGLHVDWKNGTPGGETPENYFSAIFTNVHYFLGGSYCFIVEVDDGAKLLIDGKELLVPWWGYTPGAIYKAPLTLEEGPHSVQVQYYDENEIASLHIWWYDNPSSECVTINHPGLAP